MPACAKATGWEVVAVPGLVPDITFFTLLAERKFPAGYWIRKPEQIDYNRGAGHLPRRVRPCAR